MSNFMPRLHQIYLTAYRLFGFTVLTAAVTWLLIYGAVLLFFLGSTSWVAPTRLAITNDRMLQFKSGLQQLTQNIETLTVARDEAIREAQAAQIQVARVEGLIAKIEGTSKVQSNFTSSKKQDISKSQALAHEFEAVEQQVQENYMAHLITQQDTVLAAAQLQNFRNTLTDSKLNLHTQTLTIETELAALATQLEQAQNEYLTKTSIVNASNKSLQSANEELTALQNTSYYYAWQHNGANLVFIPYDNLGKTKVGDPIYDCYLMMIFCHKVGSVQAIYSDEQLVDFPLFNIRLTRTDRGVFMATDVDSKYISSRVMFLGKPLWF